MESSQSTRARLQGGDSAFRNFCGVEAEMGRSIAGVNIPSLPTPMLLVATVCCVAVYDNNINVYLG